MTTGECDSIALAMAIPDMIPNDIETLRTALAAEQLARREAEARASGAEAMVAHLKLLIAKLRHERFGASSERGRKLLDQMELQLEELEAAAAEDASATVKDTVVEAFSRRRPTRAPLPEHLPRERVVIPGPAACPCCGGRLAKLGETITETLEVIPRQWKVVQTVREKFTCRACEAITQPPAPFHPIARGRAGPNLLAMILTGKFCDHQPLNRQSDAYAREGIDLDVSTLADWVGACTATLAPLVALIRSYVMAAGRIHGDDTTVPVLAKGQTITGRLWTYVRDDRPFAGPAPPAAVFFYSRNRAGEHPNQHLAGYDGILQADAYAGFNELYAPARQPGPITEAACWAHGRRKFFELAEVARAPLAVEAVRRIDAIFDIERSINGLPTEQRLAVRQERIVPLVQALETWMRAARRKMSRHADVAKAMDYMLKRWDAFGRFLGDGRICLSNNAAERALRGIAMAGSLCTPSSSAWKHWKRIGIGRAIRARLSGDRTHNRSRRQVTGADLVGRAGNNLLSGKDAGFNKAAYCMVCDAQQLCRLAHGKPCAVFFRRSIGADPTHPSH
jgi:transposase